jgi:hypothetical protein
VAAPWSEWARFAASYLAVVALEPLITVAVLLGGARLRSQRWAALCFDTRCANSLAIGRR